MCDHRKISPQSDTSLWFLYMGPHPPEMRGNHRKSTQLRTSCGSSQGQTSFYLGCCRVPKPVFAKNVRGRCPWVGERFTAPLPACQLSVPQVFPHPAIQICFTRKMWAWNAVFSLSRYTLCFTTLQRSALLQAFPCKYYWHKLA